MSAPKEISSNEINNVLSDFKIRNKSAGLKILEYLLSNDNREDKAKLEGEINEPGSFRPALTQLKNAVLVKIESVGHQEFVALTAKCIKALEKEHEKAEEREERLKALEPVSVEDKLQEFFKKYYKKKLLALERDFGSNPRLEYVFLVDFHDLEKYDYDLADVLLNEPDAFIPQSQRAIKSCIDPLLRVSPQFKNTPIITISELESKDVGRYVTIEGIVKQRTDKKHRLTLGVFECQRCGNITRLSQDEDKVKEPFICEDCERKGPFKLLPNESTFEDYQKLKVEEKYDSLKLAQPRSLEAWVTGSLVDKAEVGDIITIAGVYRLIGKRKERVYSSYLEVNSIPRKHSTFEDVEITQEDEKEILKLSKDPKIYDNLIGSFAPSIAGYTLVKESLVYQMFGSNPVAFPDGTVKRGDSHVLLIGEPGVGKSDLLKAGSILMPKSRYSSAWTGGGLTAIVQKDEFADGAWTIQAGLMPLCNGSGAYIDEFDKTSKEDRVKLHEASEQQTISISKAGINATLPARCFLAAAGNPKFQRFDNYKDISSQLDIEPTLLSRFDLIWLIRDEVGNDAEVADKIVKAYTKPDKIQPIIAPDLFRKFIIYSRKNCDPRIPNDVQAKLKEVYMNLRKSAFDADQPIPVTARQLGALIRLMKARARIQLRDVTMEDFERVSFLLMESLKQVGLDEHGRIDIDKIMAGATRTQRDRMIKLFEIIRGIEREYGTAKESEIIERALEEGISKREALEGIEKLKADGHIYDPRRDGRYKSV